MHAYLGVNGEASPAPSVGFKMPPPALLSLTHSTTGPLPFHSHRNMHLRGPGVRPTEDHERHRRLDAASLARCERRNEERHVQVLQLAAARAIAPPPPPPPRSDMHGRRSRRRITTCAITSRCQPTVAYRPPAQHGQRPGSAAPHRQARLDYIQTLWQAEVDGAVRNRAACRRSTCRRATGTSWWMSSKPAASEPSPAPASSRLTTCSTRRSHLFRLQDA